jgi:SAM-dependent methyltransferase
MHEILRHLQPGGRVLDVGSATGSFPREATLASVVRVDRDRPRSSAIGGRFIQADAACLPFSNNAFDAVISNHSLEHFADLNGALSEIGRVIRPGGSLYIAIPDASTFTDKLYRWLTHGGGHVNAFTSPEETAATMERATGLPLAAAKTLCSSCIVLNRRNFPGRGPRRYRLLSTGGEPSLWMYVWLSRRRDRLLKTRLSVYGWAFYFGRLHEPVDITTWTNVCVRCGSGYSAEWLLATSQVRANWLGIRTYRCPQCGAGNPLTADIK